MKKLHYIVSGWMLATCLPCTLQAQTTHAKDTTLNRTVVVEQEYNPLIMDAQKVNVLPLVEEPTVSKKKVEYATTFFPATTLPTGLIEAFTGKEIQPQPTPGYARAGYGNRGNLDVLANYLFRLSKRDKLNLRFQMDGMDGKLTLPLAVDQKWNAFYYHTQAGVDYSHQFNKLNLNLAGTFGLTNFNYIPNSFNPKQKFTAGSFHAGLHFLDETAPLRFHAETNVLLYERQHNMGIKEVIDNNAINLSNTSIKEAIVRTQGYVTGAINDQQAISIALEMNNLLYNGYTQNKETGDKFFDNYTTLGLTPYYELNNDQWRLHVGAHVDLSFGFDQSFRISPDVQAQYIFADSYIAYIKATGGKQLNDFRQLENICPYSELPPVATAAGYVARPLDTYEPLNAAIGFKASPFPGIWFHLYGGYQILKNELGYLMSHTDEAKGLCFAQDNTENVYVGGEFTYDYKDIIGLTARYTYRQWDSKSIESLLAIKPCNELSLGIRIHPFAPFQMQVGFDYIQREKIKDATRLKAVSDLHARASYQLFKGISAYVQAHNLLNEKYSYFTSYPAQGFHILGGLSFRF